MDGNRGAGLYQLIVAVCATVFWSYGPAVQENALVRFQDVPWLLRQLANVLEIVSNAAAVQQERRGVRNQRRPRQHDDRFEELPDDDQPTNPPAIMPAPTTSTST